MNAVASTSVTASTSAIRAVSVCSGASCSRTASRRYSRRPIDGSLSSSSKASRRSYSQTSGPSSTGSSGSLASTSLLNSLRFEIGQANPDTHKVWVKLNELYRHSPQLVLDYDLLQSAVLPLSSYRRPPKHALRGTPRIVARQEEAEALYARYRFVYSRLHDILEEQAQGPLEEGSGKKSSMLMDSRMLMRWLDGFERLAYAPASWRIWQDVIQEAEAKGEIVGKRVADSVLIATARYLRLLRENNEEAHAVRAKEALRESRAVLEYVEKNGHSDWITRSLSIRIVKEAGSYQDTKTALKKTFGFDLDLPSLATTTPLSNAASSSTSFFSFRMPVVAENIREGRKGGRDMIMDKHSVNSVLSMCAAKQDLSKMISVFEAAAHPTQRQSLQNRLGERGQDKVPISESFFSMSHLPAIRMQAAPSSFFTRRNQMSERSEEVERQGSSTTEAADHELGDVSQPGISQEDLAKMIAEDVASEMPASTVLQTEETKNQSESTIPILPFSSFSINTFSFELLIDTACRLNSHGVALHYLHQLSVAWQQERERLQAIYAHLAIPQTSRSSSSEPALEENADTSDETRPHLAGLTAGDIPCKVEAPSIGPSLHALYAIYDRLKHVHKDAPMMSRLLEEAQSVLKVLREDIRFWSDVGETMRQIGTRRSTTVRDRRQQENLASAISDHGQSEASSSTPAEVSILVDEQRQSEEEEELLNLRRKTFSTRLHLLLSRRAFSELSTLVTVIEHRQGELATERFLSPLLYELSGRREKSKIARLKTAMKRAERWLRDDEGLDKERVQLAMTGYVRGGHGHQVMIRRSLSEDQKRKKANFVVTKYQDRRRKVRVALGKAKVALPHLIEDARMLRQGAEGEESSLHSTNGDLDVGRTEGLRVRDDVTVNGEEGRQEKLMVSASIPSDSTKLAFS